MHVVRSRNLYGGLTKTCSLDFLVCVAYVYMMKNLKTFDHSYAGFDHSYAGNLFVF